ncbi:MAG: diaminopimelate decarboxylase [Elusimicrobiota bacterium]
MINDNNRNINYQGADLYVEDVPVKSIIAKIGTPVFIYSGKQLEENYITFSSAFKAVNTLVCYALKANNNIHLVKKLAAKNAGADITSGGELYAALKSGVPGTRTVYAGVGKRDDEIVYALRSGVLLFNMESIAEMEHIDRIAGRIGLRAKVGFRFNPNVDAHTHKHITTGKNETKFGISYPSILDAYRLAGKKRNLDVAGIHLHIGSQITELGPFKLVAEKAEMLYRKLCSMGFDIRYIDLGGGLGIRYDNETPPVPSALAQVYASKFKDIPGLTLILEPGRYIVGNSGILVTSVLYGKKSVHKNFLIVDSGMCDLIRPALYDAYHEIVPVKKSNGKKVMVDIVGPVCETSDYLGKDRMLPFLASGTAVAVGNAGAYGFMMSSNYNARPRAAEVMVTGSKWKLIRKRETVNDIFSKIV